MSAARPTRRAVLAGGLAAIAAAAPARGRCGRDEIDRPMLAVLRARYELDHVTGDAADDLDRVRRLATWTRSRWRHNGSNEPSRPDPLTVLAEAEAGARFRCVEYAEVLAAALGAVGVPARVLGLQRADVETAERDAGHVVAEAWLRDAQRWMLVDGQFDTVAMRGADPLSARELQTALADGDPALRIESFSGMPGGAYKLWIAPYLHFYMRSGRRWTTGAPAGMPSLMLIPPGASPPKVFQRRFPQHYRRATESVGAFYAPPPRCDQPSRRSS